MHTLKLYLCVVSLVMLLLLTVNVPTGAAADLFELKTSGQQNICTYLVWDIMQRGWDKEAGLKITLSYFDSGAAQVEALPSKQWAIANSIGGVPSMVAAMRYGSYIVAVGNECSLGHACLVRPDSPILKATGANPNYPKTYGSAATVKGKTMLVTTVSTGHYALATWLKRLGLKEKDVVVKNMDQGQIMAAFESGIGDVAVVWEPYMFVGMRKGWKMVSEDSQKGAEQINAVLVDKPFADEHPDIVAKFLKLYIRRNVLYKPDSSENVDGYVKFSKDWAGVELSKSDAVLSINTSPMYSMNDQLKVYDTSKGQSEIQKWFVELGDFFVEQRKFTREEVDKVLQSGFITDKFLKMAAAMK
jgi:ABC-type nitrate/sulfonate/bicarbonate transport system substrate-binding protein